MYTSLISAFGAATIVAVIRPEFRQPQYRWIRSCLFLAMGLSAVFPVLHALVIYGVRITKQSASVIRCRSTTNIQFAFAFTFISLACSRSKGDRLKLHDLHGRLVRLRCSSLWNPYPRAFLSGEIGPFRHIPPNFPHLRPFGMLDPLLGCYQGHGILARCQS